LSGLAELKNGRRKFERAAEKASRTRCCLCGARITERA
jgi:hypothetical protein